MSKEFNVTVNIVWSNYLSASDESEAREIVKQIFKDEHNLDLDDIEIISIEEVE
jgi:hypothetical protein